MIKGSSSACTRLVTSGREKEQRGIDSPCSGWILPCSFSLGNFQEHTMRWRPDPARVRIARPNEDEKGQSQRVIKRSSRLEEREREEEEEEVALRTPVPKHAHAVAKGRYERVFHAQEEEEGDYVRPRPPTPVIKSSRTPVFLADDEDDEDADADDQQLGHGSVLTLDDLGVPTQSSPPPREHAHVRRGSDTSSLFPMPPPNMSMIMQEDDPGRSFFFNQTGGGGGMPAPIPKYSNPLPPLRPTSGGAGDHDHEHGHEHDHDHDFNHTLNTSISSALSVDRTMSPTESLDLDPMHDRHLRDLEQVDLGVGLEEVRGRGLVKDDEDAW
ncbi:hypothetical protein NMY22_g2623 [Coprinellus aureogranulatus]|nr:hypothetical protein NMY22_g2623 [Coprinellus aureogranulatus]